MSEMRPLMIAGPMLRKRRSATIAESGSPATSVGDTVDTRFDSVRCACSGVVATWTVAASASAAEQRRSTVDPQVEVVFQNGDTMGRVEFGLKLIRAAAQEQYEEQERQ